MKLALIGGRDIKKYTVADKLWNMISSVYKLDFSFEIFALENEDQLIEFFDRFKKDRDFIGFNVALPWKESLKELVDYNFFVSENCKSINTVYKKKDKILTSNTDVAGISRSLANFNNLNNILILGLGGAGYAVAEYFVKNGFMNVFAFDVLSKSIINNEFKLLNSYEDIIQNKYDVIINATPLGKYYFNSLPKSFIMPLSPFIIKQITHEKSIIQEMNYFPVLTPILEIGNVLNLHTISGIEMLVNQALESLYLYTNKKIDVNFRDRISESMKKYAYQLEKEVLSSKVI